MLYAKQESIACSYKVILECSCIVCFFGSTIAEASKPCFIIMDPEWEESKQLLNVLQQDPFRDGLKVFIDDLKEVDNIYCSLLE